MTMPLRLPRSLAAPLLLLVLLSGCLLDSEKTARGSVVENEVAGILRAGDGPAAGARVTLYSANAGPIPGVGSVKEVVTDADGRFRFIGLAEGAYSILGRHDTLLAFQDSILVARLPGGGKTLVSLPPDTLRPAGGIEVKVTLKPGDDPASITGEVLGTPFNAHAGANGDLSMGGMPAGRLRVRFTSSLPGYLPLTVAVEVAPGAVTRAGTLALPY
jgi:hypothetical protein